MAKLLALVAITFCFQGFLWAQTPHITSGFLNSGPLGEPHLSTVRGAIFDTLGQPLKSITVCLISYPDKSSIILAQTSLSGYYEFPDVPSGSYIIQASRAGAERKTSGHFEITEKRTYLLARIYLRVEPLNVSSTYPKNKVKRRAAANDTREY